MGKMYVLSSAKRSINCAFKSLIILLLLSSSCSVPLYYQPPLLDLDRNYIPKPMVTDSVKSLYGLSGSYINTEYNFEDIQDLYELNFTGAHLLKNVHLSYGSYLFWGSYVNGSISQGGNYYFSSKQFNGYGIRGAINYVQAEGRTEWRFPGLEFSYSHEGGTFAQYRKSLLSQNDYYTNPQTSLFTAGITNEVVWKSYRNPNIRYGLNFFIGRAFGDMTFYNSNNFPDNTKEIPARMTFDFGFMFGVKQFFMVGDMTKFDALKLTLGFTFGKSINKR